MLHSECRRARIVALVKRAAAEPMLIDQVDLGLVDPTEPDRFDVECIGQLVDRALEREHVGDFLGGHA